MIVPETFTSNQMGSHYTGKLQMGLLVTGKFKVA